MAMNANRQDRNRKDRTRVRDPVTGTLMGRVQLDCLQALRRYRVWPGGWAWNNDSTTRRILDSLVRRRLATQDLRGVYRPVNWNADDRPPSPTRLGE